MFQKIKKEITELLRYGKSDENPDISQKSKRITFINDLARQNNSGLSIF